MLGLGTGIAVMVFTRWSDFEGVGLSLVSFLFGDMCLKSLLGLLIFTGNGV